MIDQNEHSQERPAPNGALCSSHEQLDELLDVELLLLLRCLDFGGSRGGGGRWGGWGGDESFGRGRWYSLEKEMALEDDLGDEVERAVRLYARKTRPISARQVYSLRRKSRAYA
jgi:hypothetical protein